MKKLLTFLFAALLTTGVGWAETVTFEIDNGGGGILAEITSSNQTVSSNGITLTFDKGTSIYSPQTYRGLIRFFTGNTLNITSNSCIFTSIVFTYGTGYDNKDISLADDHSGIYNADTNTWTGSSNSLTFVNESDQTRFYRIVITYEIGTAPQKEDVTLSFPESSYSVTMGQAFAAPALTVEPAEAASEVVYSSSNTAVATVDETTGTVTIVGEGTTTITAGISNSETYNNVSASYTLTVNPDLSNIGILDFTDYTLWTPNLPNTSSEKTVEELTFNDGTYTVKIAGSKDNGYYYTSGYLLLGTKDAYIQLPAFSKAVEKIVVEGTNSASASVKQNIYVGDVAVSTEALGKGTSTFEIAEAYQAPGNVYTLKVTNAYNTQIKKIYIYFNENAPAVPVITVNPTELNINEDGGTFTVNGYNLPTDGLGVNVSEGFSRELLNGNNEYYFFPVTSGSVENGQTKVYYTGRELSATGTITFASGSANASAQVNYKSDIYIVTDNGVQDQWNFNEGTKMEESDGIYTAEITTTAPNTFILFAKKLGEGVGFNTRYVFGPTSNGDWEMPDQESENGTIDLNDDDPIYFPYAGIYAITINANEGTFTINRTLPQVAKPTFDPAAGNYDQFQTVTIACATADATISYSIDGGTTWTEGNAVEVKGTMTIQAKAAKEGMRDSEVAQAAYTLPTVVADLESVNRLSKNTKFIFNNDVVVTFVQSNKTNNGKTHTLVGLRDKSENKADGKGGSVFYDTATDLTAGTVVTAGWYAQASPYNGWMELINANYINTNGTVAVEPFDRTGQTLEAANQSEYIILRDVTIEGTNATISNGAKADVSYLLYDRFDTGFEDGNYEYLIGVVSIYGEDIQVYPLELKAKKVAGLSYGETTAVNTTFGEEFTAPTLSNPNNLAVTYTSSNTDVATVDENGNVTIVGAGEATITATSEASAEYLAGEASYTITVAKADASLNYATAEYDVVEGDAFTAPELTNPNGLSVTYSSNNADVATVNEDGAVTIVGVGTAVITATFEGNKQYNAGEASYTIHVTARPVIEAPTFSLVSGSYTGAQSVTINCATAGATIKYSTDGGNTWTTGNTVNVDKDMTIVAMAEKDGWIAAQATAYYIIDIPEALPTITPFKGYYAIKNNGNGKYANVQGRKTLTFTDAIDKQAGTVIWLETNEVGQVKSLRSQGADLQGYADRAMKYVPKFVELAINKLHAEGEGELLGENGYKEIMDKFNECFDHHLYVEEANGGWRLYGKTPSMQHVVDFYREHTHQVETKLPMLEDFINSAITKVLQKTNGKGASILKPFSVHQTWQRMDSALVNATLTEPVDSATTMEFYREVLNNKNYVWAFAYETAMTYWERLQANQTYQDNKDKLGEFAQYLDKIEDIRPDFKYYIVQENNKPDYVSEGNVDIIRNNARTIWTLEPRETFIVNIPEENLAGCELDPKYVTTLYTDFAYTLPSGVKAYKVINVTSVGAIEIEEITDIIPAQTPVLLKSDNAGDMILTLSEVNGAAVTENLLVGADYLIEQYQLITPEVKSLFDFAKNILGETFYNNYLLEYEHLMYKNSGTVNNKYFWALPQSDVEMCYFINENYEQDCVIRTLSVQDGTLAFNNNGTSPRNNEAFLVSDTFNSIGLYQKGDVNHDGVIDVLDVTMTINYILGAELESFFCTICADADNDGTIDVNDVTTIIAIILTSN